jgi:hypothetical protein
MMNPYDIKDETYIVDNGAGIGQYLAVVLSTTVNEVTLPAGANAGGIAGITQESQDDNKPIRVRPISGGVSYLVVNGAGTNIAVGDPIIIDGVTGRGKKGAVGVDKIIPGYYLGKALDPATTDGKTIRVQLA